MIVEKNEQELLEAIKSGKKIVVKMWMDDCTFCDQYAPTFEKVSAEFKDLEFLSFNMPARTGGQSEFKRNYMKPQPGEKLGAPCTYIFEGGEMKARRFGLMDENQLRTMILTGQVPDSQAEVTKKEYVSLLARRGEISFLSEQYGRELVQIDARLVEIRNAMGLR